MFVYDIVYDFLEVGGIFWVVECCNGFGDCCKLNFFGGIMCFSYWVICDEKDIIWGGVNILWEFFIMNVYENFFDYLEIYQAMDFCLVCKGCIVECFFNVDMMILKLEFLYQY